MKIDLTEDQFQDIVKILDRDGSGQINYYEFDRMLLDTVI
jgi:Ca2+-binding EF-hand superfamily protein